MRNECNIIRDILPLYVENMVSADTAAFVEEHLKRCEACQKEYARSKQAQPKPNSSDAAPLLMLRRKMKIKRIQTIALTAVFVLTLLVSAFAVLDAPVYFPYSEELVTAEPVGDNGLRITFDPAVTDFHCTVYLDPDGGFYHCDIEAWTSLWDKWFSKNTGALSTVVFPEGPHPISAEYLPNDGSENVCVYGALSQSRGIALPRLSLAYYLILAFGALAILAVAWLLTRKKPALRVWAERLGLYPAAYIISHCIVSGIGTTSYSLPRDFSLIVFLSILLYSGLLLAHSNRQLKKEIADTSGSF